MMLSVIRHESNGHLISDTKSNNLIEIKVLFPSTNDICSLAFPIAPNISPISPWVEVTMY
jgi:hypothetical protein